MRLFRPFSVAAFAAALPKTVRAIAVLDRTKEPGAVGEPLYLDVVAALREARETGLYARDPLVIGGRYGLSSKEFTPAMVKAVFDELARERPRNHFTVGIVDDVTHTSLPFDPELRHRARRRRSARCSTAWAPTARWAPTRTRSRSSARRPTTTPRATSSTTRRSRGRSRSRTCASGPGPIRSAYLIRRASFVACHQFGFLEKYDILECATPGAVFLLNAPYGPDEVWDQLPREVQEQIIDKKLKVYVIDAMKVARETGMGGRINTIMQTCFFAISGVLPREEAIAQIKRHRSRRPTARRGTRSCAATSRRWTRPSPTCTR